MKRALMKQDVLARDVKELQDAEKSRVGSILPRKDIRRNQNPRTHQRGVVLQMAINAIIPTPEPDRVVEVTAEQCDRCSSTNLSVTLKIRLSRRSL